jgi:hypothetical protein
MKNKSQQISRRKFIQQTGLVSAAALTLPYLGFGRTIQPQLLRRPFGKIPFEVTTFGLGGLASLQWTPEDVICVVLSLKRIPWELIISTHPICMAQAR